MNKFLASAAVVAVALTATPAIAQTAPAPRPGRMLRPSSQGIIRLRDGSQELTGRADRVDTFFRLRGVGCPTAEGDVDHRVTPMRRRNVEPGRFGNQAEIHLPAGELEQLDQPRVARPVHRGGADDDDLQPVAVAAQGKLVALGVTTGPAGSASTPS